MRYVFVILFSFLFNSVFSQKNTYNDKSLHFGAGIVISTSTSIISKKFGLKHPYLIGFTTATLAGIAKEAIDYKFGGDCDALDANATMLGGLFGSLSIKIIIPN